MLKKRIIPILLYNNGRLVKSKKFTDFRDVGNPVSTAKIYCDQDADELVILNVNPDDPCSSDFLDCINQIGKTCNVPLTIGGGITKYSYAQNLFSEGADKILMGTNIFQNSDVASKISKVYGSQALVACMDYKKLGEDNFIIRSDSHNNKYSSLEDFLNISKKVEAGELLIQSVEKDGTCEGLDIDFFNFIKNKVSLPIIMAGGCGDMEDFRTAFENGANAIGCGSFFCFGDNNPLRVKSQLSNYGLPLKRIK